MDRTIVQLLLSPIISNVIWRVDGTGNWRERPIRRDCCKSLDFRELEAANGEMKGISRYPAWGFGAEIRIAGGFHGVSYSDCSGNSFKIHYVPGTGLDSEGNLGPLDRGSSSLV